MTVFTSTKNEVSKDESQERELSLIPIAQVTICLDSDHDKCTGRYVDTSGTYVVKCNCPCHSDKKLNKNDESSGFDDTSVTMTGI
jgi:hypothetical protein